MQKTTNIVLVAILVVMVGFGLSSLKSAPAQTGYVSTDNGFVITKKVAYTDLTTSGVDISNVVQSGDLIIENIIVQTDSVGMASGTNFSIDISGNTYGESTVLVQAVSGLGASQTVDLDTAATTKQRTVIEDGSKLVASCSAADCMGTSGVAGSVVITMQFSKVDRQAYIYE